MITDEQLDNAERWFAANTIDGEVQLSVCEKIIDVPLFVNSHLCILRNQKNNELMTPYLIRLRKLRKIIQNNGQGHGKRNFASLH